LKEHDYNLIGCKNFVQWFCQQPCMSWFNKIYIYIISNLNGFYCYFWRIPQRDHSTFSSSASCWKIIILFWKFDLDTQKKNGKKLFKLKNIRQQPEIT
jgi:hypothetical protein